MILDSEDEKYNKLKDLANEITKKRNANNKERLSKTYIHKLSSIFPQSTIKSTCRHITINLNECDIIRLLDKYEKL